jgi:hypothetical protein
LCLNIGFYSFEYIFHFFSKIIILMSKKGTAIPLQAWPDPLGCRRLRLTEFLDNRHMKVASLSAIRTGRLYNPGNIPGIHFCSRLSRQQSYRNRDFPACTEVPQPKAQPRKCVNLMVGHSLFILNILGTTCIRSDCKILSSIKLDLEVCIVTTEI